jgi:hypothetical protein
MVKLALLLLALAGSSHGADLPYDSNLPVVISSGTRRAGVTADGRQKISSLHAEADFARNGDLFGAILELNLATGENNIMLVVNLATSTVNVILSEGTFDTISKGNSITYRLYSGPVVTSSGTAVSAFNSFVSTSAATTQAQIFQVPVTSSRGTQRQIFSSGKDSNTEAYDFNSALIIPPGQKVLFTGQPSANNTVGGLFIRWHEEAP